MAYNTRTTKILSLSLPPELLKQANQVAKNEGRTKSELFREALRRYIQEKKWRDLQNYGAGRARKQNLTEDDVNLLIAEDRGSRQ